MPIFSIVLSCKKDCMPNCRDKKKYFNFLFNLYNFRKTDDHFSSLSDN